ncbi:GSCOCG00003273001-RA-CDS [Cotesia congregata]|nr:GSCOCG00003273001-RA-CDS [Cotesia congregata]
MYQQKQRQQQRLLRDMPLVLAKLDVLVHWKQYHSSGSGSSRKCIFP